MAEAILIPDRKTKTGDKVYILVSQKNYPHCTDQDVIGVYADMEMARRVAEDWMHKGPLFIWETVFYEG